MSSVEYTLFDTSIGRCAIAWTAAGVAAVQLPEEEEAATVARLLGKLDGSRQRSPPRPVRDALERIAGHLAGRCATLEEVPLALESLPPFRRRVYAALRRVPPGKTVTYGELAALAGSPGACRAVGQAMARNRFPLVVPCHRVLAAGGAPGGFSAAGGLVTKARLLALEGVSLGQTRPLFDGDHGLPFDFDGAARRRRAGSSRR